MATTNPASAVALVPLTSLQQAIWREAQINANGPLLRGSLLRIELSGVLDEGALRQSLIDLATRHDALRATIDADGNSLRIGAKPESPLVIHDYRQKAASDVTDAIAQFQQLAFDLCRGPLLRHELFKTSNETHVLVLAVHPIVCDGWSLGVICEDLAAAYRAYAGKSVPPIASGPGIGEFLKRQTGADAAYWTQTLSATAAEGMVLPVDLPPADNQTGSTEYLQCRIPLELAQEIKAVCGQNGVSLFSALGALFCAQLSRLTANDAVTLYILAAGQLADDLERMVGQCARWLPARINISGNSTGVALMRSAQSVVLDAYDHQDCDIDAIVAQNQSVSNVRCPRVAFNLDPDANNSHTKFDPLQAQATTSVNVPLPFELFLNATTDTQGIAFDLRYDASLFSAATCKKWLKGYVAILQRFAANPGCGLAELTAPPDEDLQRIAAWNETSIKYSSERCVHELLEAQVLRTPKAIAVSHGAKTLTYAELNARANRFAHHLRATGVVSNTRVAICLERSLDMIVAVVAVLKAGAAYMPLDPAYPADRLAHMLTDGAPKVLVTQKSLAGVLQDAIPAGLSVTDIAMDAALWAGAPEENLPLDGLDGTNLAYVIYTSGSTGMPKGVCMPHRALVNLLHWQLAEPRFSELKRTLQFAALGFDVAFQEIFSTLSYGGELVVIDEEVRFSPAELFRLIIASRVERIFLPFVALQLLADGYAAVRDSLGASEDLGCVLGEVITAGEQVRVEPRISAMFKALPGCRLINHYGPTESHVVTCHWLSADVDAWPLLPSIGKPIANSHIYLLDAERQPVPIGVAGELFIGGICVASGYLNRDDLTSERFLPDPFSNVSGARMYKTGDLARWRTDGNIDYLGRNDFQVKIRGFRVELGEIEARLAEHPALRDAAVTAREDMPGVKRLVAYYTPREAGTVVTADTLRTYLTPLLPDYMVPAVFMQLDALPVTPNGKLDRRGLPAPGTARPVMANPYQAPTTPLETLCASAFGTVLGIDEVGRTDNFFELGGSSVLAVRVLEEIRRATGMDLSVPTLFAQPTPAGLARELGDDAAPQPDLWQLDDTAARGNVPIAIIGMAGRFPGAADVEALWDNLLNGRDGITRFSRETLDPSIDPALTGDSAYVAARGIIDGAEDFDAAFFGISAREAEVLDPQQRVFLEIAWECLERAGYAPDRTTRPVGVFAGTHTASYLRNHILKHPEAIERVGDFQVMVGNDKDYIATRVAFKLNLKGPAVSVNTACSTSLVAISQAVESLRAGRCAMALAGGATVTAPCRSGYLYEEGAMLSADGRTRTFDAAATGTAFNDGAAVVLLKRLPEAIADGDRIHAVIRGTATNNDGGGKASFTAPSVDGQAAVIAAAHRDAGVSAEAIGYVEAHGTATPLGDPIEIEALTRAFHRTANPDVRGYCRIGSVKSNIGHLIAAAGATGVIKTAMALDRGVLPASIHFESANPKIDFARSPFVVNAKQTAWPRASVPRLAGVSSFGVGGTNAHVVLEEAPSPLPAAPAAGAQLLRLSARSAESLSQAATRLATCLETGDIDLADAAFTLDVGRSRFAHRLVVAADGIADAVKALRTKDSAFRAQRELPAHTPRIGFAFPGQGAQYAGMGSGLYATSPVFREAIDECMDALKGHVDFDLKAAMFDGEPASLDATKITQPATFCLEYALAQVWLARGLRPAVLIGHSVGEFVAAVLAGVMTLNDAIRLVAKRGALMQALPAGSMLSVRMSAAKLEPLLPQDISLAAENGPTACVVGGPTPAVEAFAAKMESEGTAVRMLRTSHAFHSVMMEPAIEPFRKLVMAVTLSPPSLPIISTLTGKPLTAEEACDSRYWARHLREPVRFSPAVRQAPVNVAFLEIGPRGTLATLIRQHVVPGNPAPLAIASLGDQPDTEAKCIALAEGQLWTAGIELQQNWGSRRRVVLPTYPFERKRYWLDAPPYASAPAPNAANPIAAQPISNTITSPMMTATPTPAPRRQRLVQDLRKLFEDVAGADLAAGDPTTTFIELGLDSLTLTQAAIQLKKAFAVKITFRQLMENYRSFDALAEYMDANLPAETVPAPAQPAPMAMVMPALSASNGAAPGGLVQQVIQQQMQLMAQQLALLGGATPAMAAMPTIAPAPVTAQTTATATTDDPVKSVTYDVKKAFGAIARIHTQGSALTDRQKMRLDAFIQRYNARTAKSKAYTALHRPHLADPRVVNNFRPTTKELTYQIVVERSKGARMWDIDGNEYVDALNGFGMSLFGWQPEFIQDVIKKQLESGYDIGPMHPLAGDVAKLVCELTGFDRAGLCNTGSEAVMAAIRIARTVTGRSLMVVFSGSYHGTFDEVIVRAGRNNKGIPAAPGIMSEAFGNILVLDYGTPETLEIIRQNADELAAVLVEPVQSRRPDFQPKEFLQEVRAITEKSGTCLIFDEVITGFRSHPSGVQGIMGIRADLSSYGKVVGGGYPIGVIAGKREYMDALDGGAWEYGDASIPTVGVTYFAGTFVRHPLALAAAKASLELMKKEGPSLQANLNLRTAAYADELNAFCAEVGAPLQIKHFASLWRTTFLEDHPLQDLLFAMMRSRGVHILDNFPCFFTTAHTLEDIALMKTAFKESVIELQEADLLPRRKDESASAFDATRPPVPGARLGKDPQGNPAWFVPNPDSPGKYLRLDS